MKKNIKIENIKFLCNYDLNKCIELQQSEIEELVEKNKKILTALFNLQGDLIKLEKKIKTKWQKK